MSVIRWTIGLALCALCAGPAMAEPAVQGASEYILTGCDCACEPSCECDQPSCCCEEPSCCCDEPSCGCENGCCDSCCCDSGSCLDCCLGEACTLQEHLTPCCDEVTYGGWLSIGYTTEHERLSSSDSDGLAFNDYPDHVTLDQAWLYVEKLAEATCCGADYGYRFDVMYGIDAQATQSYGNPRALDGPNLGAWDASLDHGPYGWAMPQLYGEVAYGDWSLKIGRWFTPVGYEVIQDTGNFFRTHTLTHYNSEPFGHTGVLANYNGAENVTLFGGWALGWDTGFEQFDGGNIFVSGATATLTDDVTFTYATTVGNLGWYTQGEDGFTQHIVMNTTLSECMYWVLQSDYTNTDGVFGDATFEGETGGLTNYLIYELNDCWSVGGRMEWWKSNAITGDNDSFYDATGGINYKPHANVTIRQEVRQDWTNESAGAGTLGYNQTSFTIDMVLTY